MEASDILQLFRERVAICEVEAGLSKADAEWIAYLDVRKLVGRTQDGRAVALPKEIVEAVKAAKDQKFLF